MKIMLRAVSVFLLIGLLQPVAPAFSQAEKVIQVMPQETLVDGMTVEGPQVLWKSMIDNTLSEGISGELLAHDNVVYVPLKGKGAGLNNGYMCAISAETGAIQWVRNVGSVSTGIVYDDGMIYCGTRDGNMQALEALTGEELWQKKTGNWQKASIKTQMVSDGGLIFFGYDDGRLYAVDRATGNERWHYSTEGILYAQPVLFDDKIFFGSSSGEFACLIKETGEEVWSAKIEDDIFFLNILMEEDRAVAVWCKEQERQERSERERVNYTAFDLINGEIAWSATVDSPETASWPVSAFGSIFQTEGAHLRAISFKDGNELWRATSENVFFPALEIIDSAIFAANGAEFNYKGTGTSFVYSFDCVTGELRWRYEVAHGLTRGIRPTNGFLSATSYEIDAEGNKRAYLFFLDTETGDEHGRIVLKKGEHIKDYSLAPDGTYYVSAADEDNNEYIYKIIPIQS
jgi:outer membrane protein assembly factor BamB